MQVEIKVLIPIANDTEAEVAKAIVKLQERLKLKRSWKVVSESAKIVGD